MIKPILLSAAIHVLVLGILLVAATIDKPVELIVDTVSIRIMNRRESGGLSGRARASSPSESPRQIRQTARIPQDRERFDSVNAHPVLPKSVISQKNMEISAVKTVIPPQPPVHDSFKIGPPGGVDPLAGLENALPGIREKTDDNPNPWSSSWANGKERGILSFPMINADEFPDETERLLNVLVRIRVSPQGEVISAEIVPPGSGDIRIDRHMHNVALQLVLEPWPDDEGVQEGHLRLLFLDGDR